MNYKLILYYLGKLLIVIPALLLLPVLVGLIYGEYDHLWSFLMTVGISLALGLSAGFLPVPKEKKLRSKEGLVIVGLSWILISLIGALPFFLDGCIPNYLDALFETVSGFTTTGGSILTNVEALPKCMLFWRSFTHWLGGMGILVFMLAIMPGTNGTAFQIFKFESPGPQVGKLTGKVRLTATILYGIYFVMTVAEFVLLLFGGIGVFDSLLLAMSTAGTGGFATSSLSVAVYDNLYVEIVIAVFMFLFSLNFNLYYLMILRHFKAALFDEELRFYVIYVFSAILVITLNLMSVYGSFAQALRYSSFTVVSVVSSTGFITADFAQWPQFSQNILLFCMFFGSCAGSTGGGLKASRVLILGKAAYTSLLDILHPHSVQVIRFNGKKMSGEETNAVVRYFLIYVLIFLLALLVISADGIGISFEGSFSAVLSCLNNAGPFFVNAFGGYESFSALSKIVFMLLMLIGRLEIFPVLLLFLPRTWRKNY